VKEARGATATKPISLGNNPHGDYKHLFFVTDAKKGGSIMDAVSMQWVHHFKLKDFEEAGCLIGGGLWVEPHPSDPKIVLVQYGLQGDAKSCLFKVDMSSNTIALFKDLGTNKDAHGLQFCESDNNGLMVINTNRQDSTLDIFKYADGSPVLQGYDLNEKLFNSVTAKFMTHPEGPDAQLNLMQDNTDKLQPDIAILVDNQLIINTWPQTSQCCERS